MDKQQKQDVDAVLMKYHRSKWDTAKKYLKSAHTGAVIGLGLDLMFTAGFGTVLAVGTAAVPTLRAAFRSAIGRGKLRDPQRQEIKGPSDVVRVIADLEGRLSVAFAKANLPFSKLHGDAEMQEAAENRRNFLTFAEEAREDIGKLLPAITITGAGGLGYGTEKYQITLHHDSLTQYLADHRTKIEIDDPRTFIKFEDAVEKVKASLAYVEKIEQDKKNPPAPKPVPEPEQPKPQKRRGFNI